MGLLQIKQEKRREEKSGPSKVKCSFHPLQVSICIWKLVCEFDVGRSASLIDQEQGQEDFVDDDDDSDAHAYALCRDDVRLQIRTHLEVTSYHIG
ncbi:hypothetical protein AXF42_Ash005908 [Apostasia shenzhenica]|uniref:Uncharacterized protein n=1 Tax=Apostasia shenzhenica TaxID=1088818 RepID=A0A2I0BCP4_9ASPA|nr:hypothetical protein AXF42_Ash005908 [Apostasia shenzhenica]